MKIWKLPSLERHHYEPMRRSPSATLKIRRFFSYNTKTRWAKFETNREPEEKKPRSSFDEVGDIPSQKLDAPHDPVADLDLQSSHGDLFPVKDMDPDTVSPPPSSSALSSSLHDDLMHVFDKKYAMNSQSSESDREDSDPVISKATESDLLMSWNEGPPESDEEDDESSGAEEVDSDDSDRGREGDVKYTLKVNDSSSEGDPDENEQNEIFEAKKEDLLEDGREPEIYLPGDYVENQAIPRESDEGAEEGEAEGQPEIFSGGETGDVFSRVETETQEKIEVDPCPENVAGATETSNDDDEAEHKESSLEGTNLDFSVLQGSQPLNHDVTKQRVTLRQKGSLAQRRRPTRNSIRSRSRSEYDKFRDSTEPKVQTSRRDEEEEDEVEERRGRDTNQTSISSHGRRDINAHTNPVLLPGLGDHIRRKTKDPKPITNSTFERPAPVDNSSPAWMAEIKLRRGSRISKPVVENTEAKEPESPRWVREALSKKKRAADVLERRASQVQIETEQPTAPPWMKELRRSNRSISNSPHFRNNNGVHPPASSSNDSDNTTSNMNVSNSTYTPSTTSSGTTNVQRVDSPRYIEKLRSREVLAPLQRSSDENSAQPPVIDNLRLSMTSRQSNGHVVSETSRSSHVLPPIKPSPQSNSTPRDDQENTGSPVPAWRMEVANRRKSKTIVPAIKPDSPMKLGEIPAWKRELVERNKSKKRDSVDIQTPPSISSSVTESSSAIIPPWQQELVDRRRRSAITRQPTSESPRYKNSDTPEWTRNVQQRRARLAECGLINGMLDQSSG